MRRRTLWNLSVLDRTLAHVRPVKPVQRPMQPKNQTLAATVHQAHLVNLWSQSPMQCRALLCYNNTDRTRLMPQVSASGASINTPFTSNSKIFVNEIDFK
jgi:hypothetical protein